MDDKTLILYSANSIDGQCCAAIAYKEFGHKGLFVACKELLTLEVAELKEEVFIMDLAISYDQIESIASQCKKLIVIDHHPFTLNSSSNQLMSKNVEFVFDIEHSATLLAWRYFHPGCADPKLVEIIEDYHMHQFLSPLGFQVVTGLSLFAEFTDWVSFLDDDDVSEWSATRYGMVLTEHSAQECRGILANGPIDSALFGGNVPAYNAPRWLSIDLLTRALLRYEDVRAAASYYDDSAGRHWTLMARKSSDVDVRAMIDAPPKSAHRYRMTVTTPVVDATPIEQFQIYYVSNPTVEQTAKKFYWTGSGFSLDPQDVLTIEISSDSVGKALRQHLNQAQGCTRISMMLCSEWKLGADLADLKGNEFYCEVTVQLKPDQAGMRSELLFYLGGDVSADNIYFTSNKSDAAIIPEYWSLDRCSDAIMQLRDNLVVKQLTQNEKLGG